MVGYEKQAVFWGIGCVVLIVLLNALSSILLPFIVGMAVAYFLDPIADRLEKYRLSRAVATTIILMTFFLLMIFMVILLFPLLHRQVAEFLNLIPEVIKIIRDEVMPWIEHTIADLPPETLISIRNATQSLAGNSITWLTEMVSNLWRSSVAFFNLFSLILITPVVSFYLLRDWDLITAKVNDWLPRRPAPVIRTQCIKIDQTLAAFVRGQVSVCLLLAVLYGVGLTLIGLKSGLLVGLGAGLIAFIPYIGAAVGLMVGVAIALFQFSDWLPIMLIIGLFIIGQILESYVLTPHLVGTRVGLHPIWIIFALLAGGALFGFTGILLAVPIASAMGVLIRFAIDRYLKSSFFHGTQTGLE